MVSARDIIKISLDKKGKKGKRWVKKETLGTVYKDKCLSQLCLICFLFYKNTPFIEKKSMTWGLGYF